MDAMDQMVKRLAALGYRSVSIDFDGGWRARAKERRGATTWPASSARHDTAEAALAELVAFCETHAARVA